MLKFFDKKICILLIVFVFSCTSFALGYYGNSNFGVIGYSTFEKVSPTPPYSNDQYAIERYKRDVDDYVRAAESYSTACNNDIREIRDAQNESIRKANRVVDEYNKYVRGW